MRYLRLLAVLASTTALASVVHISAVSADDDVREKLPIDEILVTGTRDVVVGGTKLAAPVRDLPMSIQTLSSDVIAVQNVFRPHDLVQNVSGVFRGNAVFGDNFIFRGFSTSDFLRDGYPDRRASMRDTANVEQVEVLKGPASVLYGRLEPGGTLN